MAFLDLATAIRQIKQGCDGGSEHRFFFMVGAGISVPSVPLAIEIIDHCQKQVGQNGMPQAERSSGNTADQYSDWFQNAYPHRRDRQQYLRNLIEGKAISPANLRLAHLLLEPKITNLVVTTNFDDFVSRALTLFGKPHIICDHPSTTERIDPEQKDIQIVHVHGSYWFYDCCNLDGEITARSQDSDQQPQTMAALLERILAIRSPIVIGYSGWENDVFMKSLKRRLQAPLPYNLYWFLRKRQKKSELPEWLQQHNDVYFVAPTIEPISSIEESEAKDSVALKRIVEEKTGDSQDTELSAQQVLDEMIRVFELKAPDLTQDPLQYFINHLKASLPDQPGQFNDIYRIQSVISRIEQAKERENEQVDTLESIKNALRQSQYHKAIQQAIQIPIGSLDKEQKKLLIKDIETAIANLLDYSPEELEACNFVIELYDKLSEQYQDRTSAESTCIVLLYKGIILSKQEQYEEAIAVYNNLIHRFGSSSESFFQEQVAQALIKKGVALAKLRRDEETIAVYDNIIYRFGDSNELSLRKVVAVILLNKALVLGHKLEQNKEAILVCEDIIQRFGNSNELPLQEFVAAALLFKGHMLVRLKQNREAIAVCDNLIQRFSGIDEPSLQEEVSQACDLKDKLSGQK
jgi:tetratricopeptide (TPR) repeat protein